LFSDRLEGCGKYGQVRLVGFLGDARTLHEYTSLGKARNAESCKKLEGDIIVDISTQAYGQDEKIIYIERG
jgi:hypothetical protein